jgi:hypothetical protein
LLSDMGRVGGRFRARGDEFRARGGGFKARGGEFRAREGGFRARGGGFRAKGQVREESYCTLGCGPLGATDQTRVRLWVPCGSPARSPYAHNQLFRNLHVCRCDV